MDALCNKTGAYYLFGAATGALIILQSALTLPSIHKIALYEPLLYINTSDMDKLNAAIQRYDKEVSEGKLAAAMVAVSKVDPSSAITKLPRFLLLILFTLILRIDAMIVKGDDVQLKDLMPTLDYDAKLGNETEGKLENFKDVSAEVLLLGGSKSALMLKDSLDALSKVLPHINRIELSGLDHKSAMNTGKPERIAPELRRFFN